MPGAPQSPVHSPAPNGDARRLSQHERRMRETAASVAIMQEKLRAMGAAVSADEQATALSATSAASAADPAGDADYDSADTASHDECDTPILRSQRGRAPKLNTSPEVLAQQLKEKTASYKQILMLVCLFVFYDMIFQ